MWCSVCWFQKSFTQGKKKSYSHQVICETTEKNSPWAMFIYDKDSCSGDADDMIINHDGGNICTASPKYNVSANVDCTQKGEWSE